MAVSSVARFSFPWVRPLRGWCAGSVLLAACGGGSARVEVATSSKAPPAVARAQQQAADEAASAPAPAAAASAARAEPAAASNPAPPPRRDPKLVRAALDLSATAPDERPRLGLRMVVIEQGPDAPWLYAVVNRGTEPVRLLADLRTLSLEITPPAPEPAPEPAPGKKQKRRVVKPPPPPKPVVCVLPRGVVPVEEDPTLMTALEPGEGVVDEFDPRLYCPSIGKPSPFVPGARVVAHLGFAEKTKHVWKKGKRVEKLVEQSAPFVARRAMPAGSLPSADNLPPPAKDAEQAYPASDAQAIKELVALPLTLGDAYAKPKASDTASDAEPLELVLTRGSDAATERDATITVSVVNRSKRPQRVFFRREFIGFELSGPDGLVSCDPGPDARAPDRSSISTLRPGGRISATSRLIELCPQGALRRAGLYLVHGRFDANARSNEEGPTTFSGRITSKEPVVIRVRSGWGDLPAQRELQRVRVGSP